MLLADFRNWFYQLRILNAEWKQWLQAVIKRRRDTVRVELDVLSMGLSLSVFIAHCLARHFARRHSRSILVSDAWVVAGSLLEVSCFWAGSLVEMQRVKAEVIQQAVYLNVEFSEPPQIYTTTFTFLGLGPIRI